jgi:hypothetical protein
MLTIACIALCGVVLFGRAQVDPKRGCRQNPAVVGACVTVHGRLFIANGTPSMRIWRIGTTRILGVLPSENEIVPSVIRKYAGFDTNVYGDFEVCPLTAEKPGVMQSVCVESADHLVAERDVEGKSTPEVFRIR